MKEYYLYKQLEDLSFLYVQELDGWTVTSWTDNLLDAAIFTPRFLAREVALRNKLTVGEKSGI